MLWSSGVACDDKGLWEVGEVGEGWRVRGPGGAALTGEGDRRGPGTGRGVMGILKQPVCCPQPHAALPGN